MNTLFALSVSTSLVVLVCAGHSVISLEAKSPLNPTAITAVAQEVAHVSNQSGGAAAQWPAAGVTYYWPRGPLPQGA